MLVGLTLDNPRSISSRMMNFYSKPVIVQTSLCPAYDGSTENQSPDITRNK